MVERSENIIPSPPIVGSDGIKIRGRAFCDAETLFETLPLISEID